MQPAALVVAAGLFGSTSAFAALDSGKTLLDSCNDPNDTSKQSYCLGYVAGAGLANVSIADQAGHKIDGDELLDCITGKKKITEDLGAV